MTTTTKEAETMTAIEHKFEKAGLGKPPFRYLGHGRVVYQAVPGDPSCPIQPGGSCDYCGTGIYDHYYIRSADGKEFKVGCECVRHTGDKGLIEKVDHARRKVQRDRRHAREAAKIEAIRAKLAEPAVQATLAAIPHPSKWAADKGKTLLDWTEWMMVHSGTTGRLKVGRAIEKAMGSACEACGKQESDHCDEAGRYQACVEGIVDTALAGEMLK
jgi:hypothetical protein